MKLEEQVASLELSKELKEAGYEQEGLWWWGQSYWGDGTMLRWDCVDKKTIETVPFDKGWVAPTVAELGERLPVYFHSFLGDGMWHCYKAGAEKTVEKQVANTEANTRAKMWLYLKKEKLL